MKEVNSLKKEVSSLKKSQDDCKTAKDEVGVSVTRVGVMETDIMTIKVNKPKAEQKSKEIYKRGTKGPKTLQSSTTTHILLLTQLPQLHTVPILSWFQPPLPLLHTLLLT